jgi:radical SAM protein with 4Fe4S-binding SPASM domain
MIWIITGRCNLDCRHCYASIYRGEPELDTKKVKELLAEASELGVEHINFTGGEPLVRKDIIEVLTHSIDLGIETSVFTNATVLTEKIAKFLYRYEISIYTSIDGPNKEVHETIRGKGSWDRLIHGLGILRETGNSFHVNISIGPLNWKYTAEIIEKAIDFGASSISLIPVMPTGNALKNKSYADPLSYNKAIELASKKAEELGITVSLWCTPYAGSLTSSKNIKYSDCRSWQVIDITPSGRLVLCDVLNITIGNIVETGLRKAWLRQNQNPLYKRVITSELSEPCLKCLVSNECKGGCYARSYLLKGTFKGPDPLCPLTKLNYSKELQHE